MAKGWNGDYERHAMARMGIKTAQPKFKPTFPKQSLSFNRLKELAEREIDKEGSDYSIGIVVPSTKHGDQKISSKEFVKRVVETKKEMSKLFNGTTSLEQVGSFVLDKGNLVEEKGVAVTSNTDKEGFEKNKKIIADYAVDKGEEWTQESMAITVETPQHPSKSLHFIQTK